MAKVSDSTRPPGDMAISRDSASSEKRERRSPKRRNFSTVNLFKIFLNQGPALGWIKDAKGRYTFLNRHFNSHIKTGSLDLSGRSDSDWLPQVIAARTKEHDDQVISSGNLMEFIESLPDHNGDLREWLVFKFPLQDESGKTYVGCVAADVHERRIAERRLATQYSVTRAFAEAASLHEVTPKFLAALCSTFFWDVGALWLTNPGFDRLSCLGFWHQEKLKAPKFLATCTDTSAASDIGLPDQVLACQAPAYVSDIATATWSQRAQLASAEGLKSGFAYPLRAGSEIFGVVEFYSKQSKDVVQEMLLMLDALSSQLGQFIQRKQAEEKLAQSNAIMQALSRAQSQFIVTGEIDAVFGILLQDIIHITESKFGFIGAVEECDSDSPQIRLHAVSRARSRNPEILDSDIKSNEAYVKQTLELESHTESSLINLILAGGKPIIYNRVNESAVRSRPESGQISASFLALPVLFGHRLVGVVALASRPSGYDESMADALKPFLSTCGIIIDAHQSNQLKEEALRALKGNENRLSTILTGAADGIITITDEGEIESVNPAAERMFQYSPGELLGKKYSVLLPTLPSEIKIAADGEPRKYLKRDLLDGLHEAKGVRKGDTIFPAEISVSEVRVKEETFYSLIVRDISERKEIERRLKEFYSTISHELRTPLTSIRGSLGLIEGGVLGDISKEVKEYLSIARDNCDRLIDLINDILDLRRIDANQIELRLAPVDPETLVHESIDKVKPIAEAKGIALELECQSKQLVNVDTARIVQALTNLLSNAVKFSPPGTLVTVRAGDAKDKMVRFSVQDQAAGIPARQIKKLFGKFQQLDSSDTRETGGTGLGLAICKSLVELHGGKINVDSEVGRGSTFWFDLPATKIS
jgi:PAS domain S-box-containing protein